MKYLKLFQGKYIAFLFLLLPVLCFGYTPSSDSTHAGIIALKSGDYGTATTDFYQAISLASTGSKDYNCAEYYMVRSFVELGNYPTAQIYITNLLMSDTAAGYQDGALYYEMRIALQQYNFSLLSTTFIQLTTAYPHAIMMPTAYKRYSEGLWKLNHDYPSAINYAQKIINQYPTDFIVPEVWVALAAAHYDYYKATNKSAELTLCEQALDQCLAQYSQTTDAAPTAQYWKGYLQQNVYSNFTSAITEYQKVITKYPTNYHSSQAQLQIASCYSALRDYTQASTAYQLVIQNYPNSPEVSQAKEYLTTLPSTTTSSINSQGTLP